MKDVNSLDETPPYLRVEDNVLLHDIAESARILGERGVNDYDSVFLLAERANELVSRYQKMRKAYKRLLDWTENDH